jgi:hypothetical protein
MSDTHVPFEFLQHMGEDDSALAEKDVNDAPDTFDLFLQDARLAGCLPDGYESVARLAAETSQLTIERRERETPTPAESSPLVKMFRSPKIARVEKVGSWEKLYDENDNLIGGRLAE